MKEMPPQYPVVVRFSHYPGIDLTVAQFSLGRYLVRRLPSEQTIMEDTPEEATLEFTDVWSSGQFVSHPIGEARLLLSWLGTLLGLRVEVKSSMVNNVSGAEKLVRRARRNRIQLPPNLDELLQQLLGMERKLLQQYLRACSTYQTALFLRPTHPKMAFILLVCAIECLSTIVFPNLGTKAGFRQFILQHLSSGTEQDPFIDEVLNSAYKIRSDFLHGGHAMLAAEYQELPQTIRAVVAKKDGEKMYAVNIDWFEQVVGAVLTNLLRSQPIPKEAPDSQLLNKIAHEEAVIRVLPKKGTQLRAGQIIMSSDIETV
jgi:hypothetical protein